MKKILVSLIEIHITIRKIFINAYNYKKICSDEIVVSSKEELNAKRLANAVTLLFNNINQPFREEIIHQIYFLLTCKSLDNQKIKEIVKIYYKNYDNSPQYLSTIIHLFIINNIHEKNIEFAFLLSNYIMVKKERGMLIPYPYSYNDYRDAIKQRDISSLIRIFFDIEIKKDTEKHSTVSKNEIFEFIKIKREEIILKFRITKLFLFGSFAKKKNTKNSDIDFLVVFDNELNNFEKNEIIGLLKEYLSKELQSDVDVLDFNYAYDEFATSEFENIITLI